MDDRLRTISSPAEIPPQYASTPIGLLLEYHNLGRPHEVYANARLLIGMCRFCILFDGDVLWLGLSNNREICYGDYLLLFIFN